MSNMRTIRVTGKGQIKVKPDMTRITLRLEGIYSDYDQSLHRASEDAESLKALLTKFDFEPTDLKTLNFDVNTEYEEYKEKGVYKYRFIGYKFEHSMKVEFESDNTRLGKILYALANCKVKPQFSLSYTVKNPEKAKNELLGKAITDAKNKASVLTQSAGVELKEIQSIDYSWGQINFEVQPMRRMFMEAEYFSPTINRTNSYDMSIEPDDIDVSDTVTVIWEVD